MSGIQPTDSGSPGICSKADWTGKYPAKRRLSYGEQDESAADEPTKNCRFRHHLPFDWRPLGVMNHPVLARISGQIGNGTVLLTRFLGAAFAAFSLAVLIIFASAWDVDAAERRVALIVGNGAYTQTPLLNTINDARAMTKTLSRLGFEVTTKLNVSQREMHRAIVNFGRELEKGGIGLFYYAGHAVQIRGKNYMIPIGASISVEDHVEPESVDLNKVFARMGGARNKLNIVVLDACRDNPFGDSFRFYSEGLAQARAPANTFVSYAAAPGEVASDGTGENSFYTGSLVEELVKEGSKIEETFKRVRASVMAQTNKSQVPWTASSITQDFYFNPKPVKKAESKGDEISRAIDREVVFWQSISESTRIGDFEAYLRQFPEGTFAGLARVRLSELKPKKLDRKNAKKRPSPLEQARTDPELSGVIDRAMDDAKTSGDDYAGQIAAAVEALNSKRQEFEENERKAEEARRQVAAAIREKANKQYEKRVADAKIAAAEAEKAQNLEASKKARAARTRAIAAAQSAARKTSDDLLKKAQEQAEKKARQKREEAEKTATKQQQIALATADEQATTMFARSMAATTKRADLMRQRMIEAARKKAETVRAKMIRDAKRDAEEKRATVIAKNSAQAGQERQKVIVAMTKRVKAAESKLVEDAKKQADKEYEDSITRSRIETGQLRLRSVAEASRAAEAKRNKQIANLKAPAVPGKSVSRPVISKPVQDMLKNMSPALRPKVEAAVLEARQKGADSRGELRAAWAAIKKHRDKKTSKTPASPKSASAGPPKDSVMRDDIQKIVDKAVRSAGTSGKDHQSQVRAALEAVKEYRAKEAEKKSPIGSILGKWRKNPELSRIIDDAMAGSKARGDDYPGQVRAALDAIKEYQTKIKRTGGK